MNVMVMNGEYSLLYQHIDVPNLYNDSKLVRKYKKKWILFRFSISCHFLCIFQIEACNAVYVFVSNFIIKGPSNEIVSFDQLCDILNFAEAARRAQENIDPVDTFVSCFHFSFVLFFSSPKMLGKKLTSIFGARRIWMLLYFANKNQIATLRFSNT